jgi:hypothetical protein
VSDAVELTASLTLADVIPAEADPWTFVPNINVGKIDANKYCRSQGKQTVYCNQLAGHGTVHPGQGRCRYHGGLVEGDGRLRDGRYSIERGGIKHPRLQELYDRFKDDPDPTGLFDEIAMLRAVAVDYIERYEDTTAALLAWHADQKLLSEPLRPDLIRGFEQAFDIWESGLKADDRWSPEVERDAERARKLLEVLRHGASIEKPKRVMDISDVTAIYEAVGRMAERIEKMRSANAISEAELNRIFNAMGRVVDVLIPNGIINDGIADELRMVTGERLKEKIRDGWLAIVTR